LDLGGHTITYAENPEGKVRFGVSAIACYDPDVRPNGVAQGEACSNSGGVDGFTILNGQIVQSSHAIAKSHAIRVGQVNSGEGLTVHDVKFQLSVDSSVAVYTTYTGHQVLYNNTVSSIVKKIANRHQLEGVTFKMNNSEQFTGGQIYQNHLTGGPQGGIFSAAANVSVHDNEISQDGYYWNDFAIYAWGNSQKVFNNKIIPLDGRGIQIGGGAVNVGGANEGAKNVAVYSNKITVIERPQTVNNNSDKPSCEMGGAYGIQFDDRPSRSSAYDNEVLALADKCEAVALKLTDVGPNNESHNNTYVAQRIENSSQIAAAVLTGGAEGFRSQDDTFIADTATIAFDWDGGSNLAFQNPVLGKGTNPAPNYVTFSFQNGGAAVSNIRIINPVFKNGAAKDSTDMERIGAQEWHLAAEYFIEWTLTLSVSDGAGKPLAGAAISIDDANHSQVFSGATDGNGKVSAVLPELHVYNSKTGVEKQRRTPYTVKIEKASCRPLPSLQINLTEPTLRSVQMDCD
jgi:hypothetical protein